MDAYDVIESILDVNREGINGGTAVQKLVYLAHKVIPELEIPPYKPQYYGPHSSELSIVLVKLVSYSFVTETKILGTMHEGYNYKLTTDGQKIIDSVKEKKKDEYEKIKKLVNTCKEFCELKTAPLSFASKIFYMLDTQDEDTEKLSVDDAVKNTRELGWDMTSENAEQGIKLLEKLNLIRVP